MATLSRYGILSASGCDRFTAVALVVSIDRSHSHSELGSLDPGSGAGSLEKPDTLERGATGVFPS